jgi:hypothetical protein
MPQRLQSYEAKLGHAGEGSDPSTNGLQNRWS